jgi:hypothetical protein
MIALILLLFDYNQFINLYKFLLDLFYNVFTLNKLPFKAGLIYFILLFLGILASLMVRLNVFEFLFLENSILTNP